MTSMTVEDRMRRCQLLAYVQDGICPWCKRPLPDDLAGTEIDHIIPRSRGGPNFAWNRQLLHLLCNKIKRDCLTDEAVVLAEKHGITLLEPDPERNRSRPEPEPRTWQPSVAMYARNCYGCGCQVISRSNDPAMRILCDACWPEDWEGSYHDDPEDEEQR